MTCEVNASAVTHAWVNVNIPWFDQTEPPMTHVVSNLYLLEENMCILFSLS